MADEMEARAMEEEWNDGTIYCTGCKTEVYARLTDGAEMYPSRGDLAQLKFYVCDTCRAFVGAHAGSDRPLGFLATKEIKVWRKNIHSILDPLWKAKKIKRNESYQYISRKIGRTFHAAEIYNVEEGKRIYEIVKILKEKLDPGPWNK